MFLSTRCKRLLLVQAQLVEKEKAFRAQGFTLKQANTRMQQMQQQQYDLEQARNREAALLEEELACCRDADAERDAEAGSSGNEVGFAAGPGATMRGTMRVGSLRPGSISPLKRKQSTLIKAMSTAGLCFAMGFIAQVALSVEIQAVRFGRQCPVKLLARNSQKC